MESLIIIIIIIWWWATLLCFYLPTLGDLHKIDLTTVLSNVIDTRHIDARTQRFNIVLHDWARRIVQAILPKYRSHSCRKSRAPWQKCKRFIKNSPHSEIPWLTVQNSDQTNIIETLFSSKTLQCGFNNLVMQPFQCRLFSKHNLVGANSPRKFSSTMIVLGEGFHWRVFNRVQTR